MTEPERYDVCLSFASEQRPYVEEVAGLLRDAGLRVFYDAYETARLWGVDLYAHFDDIYNRRSRFCVVFVSEAYAHKVWGRHEQRSAQDRQLRSATEYLLPVRFDDTQLPGLPGTLGHLDARATSPAELARLTIEKLGTGAPVATVPASVVALAADGHADVGEILREALNRCGATVPAELMSSSPAGAFAVVAESVLPIAAVTTVLVGEIENIVRTRPDLRLRIAVHRGDVPTERIATCVDVTTALEAATSAAVSDVLAGVRDASCAVVVTQRVYDTVVRPGRGGNNPSLFTVVTTADGTGLHVRVPGYPRLPKPSPKHHEPPGITTGSVGKLNYFAGSVEASHIGDNYYGHRHD